MLTFQVITPSKYALLVIAAVLIDIIDLVLFILLIIALTFLTFMYIDLGNCPRKDYRPWLRESLQIFPCHPLRTQDCKRRI